MTSDSLSSEALSSEAPSSGASLSGASPSGRRALVVTTLVLQICLGVIMARFYLVTHNSLHNNGNWVSTKASLERGVMGAQAFVFELQPLAHGHLDLSAWHGHQEIVSRTEFAPAALEFRFFLESNSHLSVLLKGADGHSTGIRFSKSGKYPSILFAASPDGEFTMKREYKRLGRFSAGAWHHVRLELDEARLAVFLDERKLKSLEISIDGPKRIGFRSGRRIALIDDIRVEEHDGRVFSDSFGRPGNWRLANAVGVATALGISALLFFLLRWALPVPELHLLAYFSMFSGVLVVMGLMLLGFSSYTKRFYPDTDAKLAREEEYWRNSLEAEVVGRIERDYSQPPGPGTTRVVFLGSSQTHGSGAATESETLVRQTEKLLNELPGDERFECVDTAVHGHRISHMSRGYLGRWIELEPSIVVVNASNNDIGYGQGRFRRRLKDVIQQSRERGIEVVLVMEPNSPERNSKKLRQLHDIMGLVGEMKGVLVIDMHSYLGERYDDGFLWWDWVHLTSFGQRLFAEKLVEELTDSSIETR